MGDGRPSSKSVLRSVSQACMSFSPDVRCLNHDNGVCSRKSLYQMTVDVFTSSLVLKKLVFKKTFS